MANPIFKVVLVIQNRDEDEKQFIFNYGDVDRKQELGHYAEAIGEAYDRYVYLATDEAKMLAISASKRRAYLTLVDVQNNKVMRTLKMEGESLAL